MSGSINTPLSSATVSLTAEDIARIMVSAVAKATLVPSDKAQLYVEQNIHKHRAAALSVFAIYFARENR